VVWWYYNSITALHVHSKQRSKQEALAQVVIAVLDQVGIMCSWGGVVLTQHHSITCAQQAA
jgi:hypothetical protein